MNDASFIMLTDDGNTLLSVRQGQDGALELLSTPVTILSSPYAEDDCRVDSSSTDSTLNQKISNMNLQNDLASTKIITPKAQNPTNRPKSNDPSCKETITSCDQVTSTQNEITTEKSISSKKKPSIHHGMKNLSIFLERINVPSKKLVRKKIGRPRKGFNVDRQQFHYKCGTCGQEFKRQYMLRDHKHEHGRDKTHRCPKCPASFDVPKNFTLHMATHNTGKPKCPECGRRFARVASLKAHLLVHEVDESLYCIECDNRFDTKAQLDAHSSLHGEKWTNGQTKRCRICGKQFAKSVLYKQHLHDHYKLQMKCSRQTIRGIRHRTAYKCRMCGKVFEKPSQLTRHLRVHTGEKPYKCNVCNRCFSQEGSVRIHMRRHKNIRPYSCTFCKADFSQRGNLKSHIRRVHDIETNGRPIYRCTRCTCVFKKLGTLNGHVKRAHNDDKEKIIDDRDNKENVIGNRNDDKEIDGTAVADAVEEGFVITDETDNTAIVVLLDKDSNDFHGKYIKVKQRYVNNAKVYDCTYCEKMFKKPSDLMRHLRVHTKEKPFKCEKCDKSFTIKANLLHHSSTIHNNPVTEKLSCSVCNLTLDTNKALNNHVNKHHTCTKCKKRFATMNEQRDHSSAAHADESIVDEDNADNELKSLTENIVLKEPLVITKNRDGYLQAQPRYRDDLAHGKGRPHKCPACPAAFMKVSHFKQHYRKHTGERPYSCDVCDSAFMTKSALKTHLLVHNRLKPYACAVCDNKFATLSSMKRHHSTHTDKRSFMCPYCNKTFKASVSCRKHMKSHKHEIAKQQLEQRNNKQRPAEESTIVRDACDKPILIDDQRIAPTAIDDVLPITTIDRIPMAVDDYTYVNGNVSVTSSSITNNVRQFDQNIPLANDTCSLRTLQENETGTVTLFNNNDSQLLSPESIREIQDKLNQKLLGLGVNISLGNVVKSHDQTDNNVTQEQPMLSIIYENGTTLHSPVTVRTTVDPNVYNPQFGNIDISQIALQNNNAMNIGIVQADSTNMINIMSNAIQENQSIIDNNVDINFIFQPNDNERVIMNDPSNGYASDELNLRRDKSIIVADEKDEKSGDYRCSRCDGKFFSRQELERHVGTHEIRETHKCYECNQEFATSLQLRTHIKEHVKKELKLKDPENAEVIITELDSSTKGKKTGNDKKIRTCHYCPKSFQKPSDLVRHIRTHTGERPYECKFCGKSFAVKCTLDSHLKVHNNVKTFHCQVCDKMFATKGSLKVHMQLHTGSKPFQCNACELRFRTSGHRNVHQQTHTKNGRTSSRRPIKKKTPEIIGPPIAMEKPTDKDLGRNDDPSANIDLRDIARATVEFGQTTEISPRSNFQRSTTVTFNNEQSLQNDIVQQQPPIICDVDQSLTDLSEMTFGTDITDGEILTLSENNQLVANLQYLMTNGLVEIQTHDPITNQVTLTTTMTLPSTDDFVKDKLADDTAVLFDMASPDSTCVPVSTAITDGNNLAIDDYMVLQLDSVDSTVKLRNEDETRITGTKSSAGVNCSTRRDCEICGKSFAKPCQLLRHKRTHTGEKPFKCDRCAKSFSQKSSLQLHYRNHTGAKPHLCNLCDKTFAQSGNLNTHMKRVHKIEPNNEGKRTRKQANEEDQQMQRCKLLDNVTFVDLLE